MEHGAVCRRLGRRNGAAGSCRRGPGGERPLEDRARVDIIAVVGGRGAVGLLEDLARAEERRLKGVVVVLVERVPGPGRPARGALPFRLSIKIADRKEDRRAGPGKDPARVDPLLRGPLHPVHVGVVARAEPAPEAVPLRPRGKRRKANLVKAELVEPPPQVLLAVSHGP